MGLISHNAAVPGATTRTSATYTLDTLERDARAAGFKSGFRTGIFFKALAFQWDKIMQTDIISKEYLKATSWDINTLIYVLVFLMCEKENNL
jgi:hypothetical protein